MCEVPHNELWNNMILPRLFPPLFFPLHFHRFEDREELPHLLLSASVTKVRDLKEGM